MKAHFEEYTLFGVFFVVTAIAQLGWALWLVLRPSRWLLGLGAVGNLSIAAVWGVDRIWGLPIGPEHWTPERVGFADSASSAFEILLALCCLALLARATRQSLQRRRMRRDLRLPLMALIVALTALLAVAALPLLERVLSAAANRRSALFASLLERPG
jgi:hypothetical protein